MIGFIIATAGSFFFLGLVIAYTRGRLSGYKAGFADGKRLAHNVPILEDALVHTDSTTMLHIECSRKFRISPDMSPADMALMRRATYHQLCLDVANELMKQKIIRPVIVDSYIRPYRDFLRTMVSFYIAPDPVFEDYPPLLPSSEECDTIRYYSSDTNKKNRRGAF